MFRANITSLLERVGHPPAKGTKRYAIVISFRALARLERLPAILSDFHRMGERLRGVLGSTIEQISETDFAVLTDQTEYSALGVVADLKMMLLKLIGGHDAEAFSAIDQTRLVRVFEMPRHRAEFLQALHQEGNRRGPLPSPKALRMLTPEDLTHITGVIDSMPRQEFVDKFVRSQPMAVIKKGMPPAVALNEYFVSITQIQQRIVPGANVLLNRPTFSLLAHELDQRMIDCLTRKVIDARPGSFNFNLDSVFTRRFEALAGSGLARNMIFELRVGDVFENFEKYTAARKFIRSFGGRIAVDGVLPAMLGPLKPARLGCEFVKILCDDRLLLDRSSIANELAEISRSGARTVLARVASRDALNAGLEMGVDVFQGFYIDVLLKDTAERNRFMAA